MVEAELVLVNCDRPERCLEGVEEGCSSLHFRPAAKLIDALWNYESDVDLQLWEKGEWNYCIHARDFFHVTTLAKDTDTGTVLRVCCRGIDESVALEAVADALACGLGEDVCPDFEMFRRSYTVERGFDASEFRRLRNREVLEAYAAALKAGRICVGRQHQREREDKR